MIKLIYIASLVTAFFIVQRYLSHVPTYDTTDFMRTAPFMIITLALTIISIRSLFTK